MPLRVNQHRQWHCANKLTGAFISLTTELLSCPLQNSPMMTANNGLLFLLLFLHHHRHRRIQSPSKRIRLPRRLLLAVIHLTRSRGQGPQSGSFAIHMDMMAVVKLYFWLILTSGDGFLGCRSMMIAHRSIIHIQGYGTAAAITADNLYPQAVIRRGRKEI